MDDILAGISHGVDFRSVYFKAWIVGVPVVFFYLVIYFRVLNLWEFKTRRGSRASDIMAFLIVAGICVAYLAVAGVIAWFGLFGVTAREELSKDMAYGRSAFVEDHLVYPMIAYQFWNLLLCLVNKDLNDPAMIGHHLVTGLLAYFGLAPYLHYHGLFYFGLAEVTNVPLTLVDVFKYFPELAKSNAALNEVCRIAFAVSFILLRLLYWPYVSFGFWKQSVQLLQGEQAHSKFVVGFFLAANLFLTGLQFLWGSKILGFLVKSGKKSKSVDEKTK